MPINRGHIDHLTPTTNWHNVLEYGAQADGITDDTTAIQAAIDAANTNAGGVVYLPAGTYIVNGTGTASQGAVRVKSNVSLLGDGIGLTTIKLADSQAADVTGIVRTPSGEVTLNVTLKNFTIDGNKANQTQSIDGFFCGVTPNETDKDEDIRLENIEAKNCAHYGFDPHEITDRLVMLNCLSHDNDTDGFVIDHCINSSLIGCKAWNNGRHGFNITTSSTHISVEGCQSWGNTDNGFIAQRGSSDIPFPKCITFNGCHAHTNSKEGFKLRMACYVTFTGCVSKGNDFDGIELKGSSYNVLTACQLVDNSQAADDTYNDVHLQEEDDTGISGNTYGSSYNIVHHNMMHATETNKTKYGIKEDADASDYNMFLFNRIEGQASTRTSLAATNTNLFDMQGDDIAVGRASSNRTLLQNSGRLKWGSSNEQTTVGSAGTASAIPSQPEGYVKINDSAGNTRVVPFYKSS